MRPATISRAISSDKKGRRMILTWEEEAEYIPAASTGSDTLWRRPRSTLREGTVILYEDEAFKESQEKLDGGWAHEDVLTALLYGALGTYDVEIASVDSGLLAMARRSLSISFEDGPRGEDYLKSEHLPDFLLDPDDGFTIEATRRWLTEESEQYIRLVQAIQSVIFNYAPKPGEDLSRVFRIPQLPSSAIVSARTIDPSPDAHRRRDAFNGLLDVLSDSPGSAHAGCEAICRAAKETSDVIVRPFSEYDKARDDSIGGEMTETASSDN